ncbi:MAG: hypothetical protein AAF721_37210, partial [Myxococcota bacterium]
MSPPLTAVFVAAAPSTVDRDGLEAELAEIMRRAQEAWPTLEVAADVFVRPTLVVDFDAWQLHRASFNVAEASAGWGVPGTARPWRERWSADGQTVVFELSHPLRAGTHHYFSKTFECNPRRALMATSVTGFSTSSHPVTQLDMGVVGSRTFEIDPRTGVL